MENVINRLKKHEGLSLIPYRDIYGFWTIGRGHKLGDEYRPGLVWTLEQADERFLRDVYLASDEFMRFKRNQYPFLDVVRSGVCVELVFWLGLGGFSEFKRMHRALAVGDYHLAALELYNSDIGKDPQLRGRVRELAEIMWEGYDNKTRP